VVSSTPRPHFTPEKDPVPIVPEAKLASGPVWTGGKSRPHRDSIPDRPARSQSLYRLSYQAHIYAQYEGKYVYMSANSKYVYTECPRSTLQDQIPEVILSQEHHLQAGPISWCYRFMSIYRKLHKLIRERNTHAFVELGF